MSIQPQEKRVLRSARFRAAGDIIVHQRQLDIALRRDGGYDFRPQFSMVSELMGNADYTIANLETTIGRISNLPYSGYPRFNTPEALLDALHDAGVDFLTLANNHILDRGPEGLRTTADRVEARGFHFGGVGRSPEERERPVVVEVNGIRIGLLCYTGVMNRDSGRETEAEAMARAEVSGVKTLPCADFSADVGRAREAGADVVIALPHWGEEYRRSPEEDTVLCAKRMIAAGVDVVLGSHPHMVQPVEYLEAETEEGEKRTGLAAYSLGNFISNQSDRYTDAGIVLDFTVCVLREGGISVENVRVLPTFCWRRDDMIQPLCPKKYMNEAPEGMDGGAWLRMRESCEELRELLDEEFPMIAD